MQNFNPNIHDQRLFELTEQPIQKGRYTLEALILLGLDECGISNAVEIAGRTTARIRTHTCSLPTAVGSDVDTCAFITFLSDDPKDGGGGFILLDYADQQGVRQPEYDCLQA